MELNDLLNVKGFNIPVNLVPNKDEAVRHANAASKLHMAIAEAYEAYVTEITAKAPLPVMPVSCEGCGHALTIVSNDGIAVGKQCSNQACLKTYTYNVADFRKE